MEVGVIKQAKAPVLLGLFAVTLGVATLLLMPSQIEGHELFSLPAVRSPAFFPSLISVLLVITGTFLAWRGVADKVPSGPEQDWPERPSHVVATLTIILIYAALIFIVGFYIASVFAVALLAPALGYRGGVVIALAAVCTTLLVYLLFERSLNVFLPGGLGS